MTQPRGPRHPRRGLLLLSALFLAPLLLAFLMYYGFGWRPVGHTNHGRLIEPPRTLKWAGLPRIGPDAGTQAAAPDPLSGRWTLLYVGNGDCDADCRGTLYFIRQTYLSLANLRPRVQRVFLATEHCCDHDYLGREQPGLLTFDASAAAAAALLAQFPADGRNVSIFIVDPLGNLMMRYDAHADPKGLRDDLKKLLSLSHIG